MTDYRGLPKLKGNRNIEYWERLVKCSLLLDDLWDVVEPDYVAPPDMTISATPTGCVPIVEDSEFEYTFAEYTQMNEKALAAIRISCSRGPYYKIKGLKTARETWSTLKALYGTESYASKEASLFALINLIANRFQDMYAYLARFREHEMRLRNSGNLLDSDFLAAMYKRGLPAHLQPFVSFQYELFTSRKEPIDLDLITSSLLSMGKFR